MNQRVRYAYTYFIHPFQVNNRKKYLESLFTNKNIKMKLFEKEKDLDIYSYFSTEARDEFFESFQVKKEEQTQIEKMTNKQKASFLSKQKCVYLEYDNRQIVPAKLGERDGIFFTIERVEIVCFLTGICFLIMKVQMEDIQQFSQILDFNYKFREISLGNHHLNNNENIKIQTDSFENAKELVQFINSVTMQYSNEKEMFVYSYVCISSEDWQNEQDFQAIQEGYQKLINVKHSQDQEKILYTNTIYETNYKKVAMTKNGLGMIASSKEDFNYTKLPYYFDRQYLYTLVIGLYRKEENRRGIISTKADINITEDELGTKILQEINKQIQVLQKNEGKEENSQTKKQKKNRQINQVLIVLLGIAVVLNLWILLKK